MQRAIALLLALSLASPTLVQAQEGPPSREEMRARLFKALDLSQEQQNKVIALREKYPDGMRDPNYRAEFETLLSPEQKEKLKEMMSRRPG